MVNRRLGLSIWLAVLCSVALPLFAQNDPERWLNVEFPRDSPVLLVSFSLGRTTARPRGSSMALDLHASLLLRNTGPKPISGLTLRVEAQDLTPMGKGSVTVPSLDIQPGDVFPVRIDLELLRPFSFSKNEGAMVRVVLDCALFNDLSAYGPDQLKSRRSLIVYELQARRDRRYMADLLRSGRFAEIREELNFGSQDLQSRQLGLELLRNIDSRRRETPLSVGAMEFRSSPVQTTGGAVQVSGNEIRSPRIQLKNVSQKVVSSVDMGWIIRDERGREFVAGSVPAAVRLAPIETGIMTETGTLRFSNVTGQPMAIGSLMAFVNDVEFADGKLWIPTRSDLDMATNDPDLRRALASSPEQQRLADIFRRKGIPGLVDELKRTN